MTGYAAVVLAAGRGRRFGGAKLLARFGDASVLAASLRSLAEAPVDQIVVVTGFHAPGVEAEARTCAAAMGFADRLRIVFAPDAAEGMGASLRAGVAALRPCRGVFVVLADMPRLPPAMFERLCAALETGADAAAPVWRGRRGHPVLFSATKLPALAGLRGDEGARELLLGLGDRLVLESAPDDGVLADIDRPEDLLDLQRSPAGG